MSPPFLLTSRLLLVPTTITINLPSYVLFFRTILSDGRVTGMAWGDQNPDPVSEEICLKALERKNKTSWNVLGFGDFGVAEIPDSLRAKAPSDSTSGPWVALESLTPEVDLDSLQWVGYGCIRDATEQIITGNEKYRQSHPEPVENAFTGTLPPWQEMVEIKYGFAPSGWGKGFATEVVRALHSWGIQRFGVRRFIGATFKGNQGSRRVLQKAGYVPLPQVLWLEYANDDQWMYEVVAIEGGR